MKPKQLLGLDVGERRIGVAIADSLVRIASPLTTLDVGRDELDELRSIIAERKVDIIVVGLPRNQHGEETAQSKSARQFAKRLEELALPVVLQDESLTSVLAEKHLNSLKKPYSKSDIDMYAAVIILEDYLEENHGH